MVKFCDLVVAIIRTVVTVDKSILVIFVAVAVDVQIVVVVSALFRQVDEDMLPYAIFGS